MPNKPKPKRKREPVLSDAVDDTGHARKYRADGEGRVGV